MCGIAGAMDLNGTREFPAQRLLAMTGAIAHRGPDDEHIHIEPGVALGARRLSIIDLAGGRQPIPNERGDIWVAFNGELFEYPELREQLLARGHRLATRCDTEAWVHLYEDHGEGMFERARGQFAVSLWDRQNRTLILGRDRVGICPLYYTERDGWLLWGSEIKALLSSGMVPAAPDPKGIDHLFSFFCAGTTRTYFEGIKSLAPGHYLRIKDGRVEVKQYWDLDFPDMGDERRLDDPAPLIDEFESLLRQSVERRLRGDVPVVSYISGGLDSTVVLGLSSRQRGAAVPSFTIGLDKAGPDERPQSIEAAQVLGSKLTTVTMDKAQIASAFPELTVAAEGPIMDTSCAALMRLAQAVHGQGYKVALTGEGADEALAGYVWFKTQKVREAIVGKIGAPIPRLFRKFMLGAVGGGSAHRPAELALGGVRPAQQDMYELISQARSVLYSDRMWNRLGDHDPYSDLSLTNDRMERWHPLNQSLYVGYKVMLAGLLMISKGDRIAMNSSVETRYPFLDDDVINFCAGISPDYKLRGMNEKWILRQVAAKTLPPQIANRPKTMFRASLAKTFLGPDRPSWVDQLLSPESLRETGYFDPKVVARERSWQMMIPRITPRRLAFDVALTCVVTTQLWHHLFCGGGLCELPTWTPTTIKNADIPEIVAS
ncbi:asparagine synthase (glutamine-hydrolyzing) [Singulisphaera acidiphila]|uniref:asparagine synthase (glutamine-hydrolyzing) n=1 Tax=Singulisphaera acidiphila (strain ATCC BAA-1392 / DSM 18658 / VKM B-2454 / MOB10) TaxID=886293 RepID=L0DIY1_SINAD|nr:asparagine synthase (glutamine-hydrolyzing) [Singulisphaera acidiphila]AGA29339.1 asparagine synthase, glutamine-hydrolyzing [Singulisphaera acidiphila DSM 18658]